MQAETLDSVFIRRGNRADFAAAACKFSIGYDVLLNRGIFESIFQTVQALSDEMPDDELSIITPAFLQETGDENLVWNCLFLAACLFVVLHECIHVLGGHLTLLKNDEASLGMAENAGEGATLSADSLDVSDSEKEELDANLARITELEADGASADLLLANADTIFSAFDQCSSIKFENMSLADQSASEQLIMMGILIVIAHLEKVRTATGVTSADHPFPKARALNVLARRILHLKRNAIQRDAAKSTAYVKIEDPNEILSMAADSIWLLFKVQKAIGSPIFFEKDDQKERDEISKISIPFLSDVAAVFERSPTLITDSGRQYADLGRLASGFHEAMSARRLADFWRLE